MSNDFAYLGLFFKKQPMSSRKNKAAAPAAVKETVNRPKAAPVVQDDESGPLKEETLVWICTILCSVIVYYIVGSIIHSVYHPDIAALKEIANKLLIQAAGVRPEPVESLLTQAGIVTIGLSLLGFYALFSKMTALRAAAHKPLFTVISCASAVAILALIYVDFSAPNPYAQGAGDTPQNNRDMVGFSNFDFYFDGIFLGNTVLLYAFMLVPAIALLFYGIKKNRWEENKQFNNITGIAGYAVVAGLMLVILSMNTFDFPYTFENKYDFNAVYYSMTQVHAGAPMLVDGFTNTYGLYPMFLNVVFKLTGLSVTNFSMVMAILVVTCFLFNFYVLKQYVANKIILLFGFLTVLFFPYLDSKVVSDFDPYFAIFPIRYIIPCTLAFLAVIYLKKKTQLKYWLTTVVMALLMLWNPEIGLVSYLSWLAMNTYADFYSTEGKMNFKKIGMHWGAGIGVAVVVFYAYKGLVYMIYGAAPDLSMLFSTMAVFGKIGFNMIPMAFVHPWNLMVLVLILGFVHAISRLSRKDIRPKDAVIFLLSVVGLGFFFYFQGRSHNWSFSSIAGFSIMLLTILGSELWEKVKSSNILALNLLFVVFLFVISFSFFEVLYSMPKLNELTSQEESKEKAGADQKRFEGNVELITKLSAEKEKILIFSAMQYQGLYYSTSKRAAAFNPGLMDMFALTDLAKLEQTIKTGVPKIFVEPESTPYFLPRPMAAAAAVYDVDSFNKNMGALSRRKTKIPALSFFDKEAETVFHKKYTDDTAGAGQRINDALGGKPLTLNPAFAVEVLFYSKPQIYPFATVAGNMSDSGGFIIARVINSNNYFFGINGSGFAVPAPDDQWVYSVMNVFPDKVEVYQNGALAGTIPLQASYRQSSLPFSIGNLGYMRYYIGAIAEVAVINKNLDKEKIAATWEEIRKM
ncbi:MAG: conserved rane protein of unknown function [Flavipsychrobacter sp.]|jgi:hypothetical protein|nr:conserved rane protein of unknown function [Flavipsychrobacter sp.]